MLFIRSCEGNLLSVMDGETAYSKAQELLESMLSGTLPITKEKRDKTIVSLENYVEAKRDGVTVMVVCNEKNHRYKVSRCNSSVWATTASAKASEP